MRGRGRWRTASKSDRATNRHAADASWSSMKREDEQRLAQPHPTTPYGRPIPDIAAALGWSIRPWRELLGEVRADLDTTNFGIGWWRLGPETDDELRRRIVVGDYLISLLEGAEHALIDLELNGNEFASSPRSGAAAHGGTRLVASGPLRSTMVKCCGSTTSRKASTGVATRRAEPSTSTRATKTSSR